MTDSATQTEDSRQESKYGAFETEGGAVVVYDRDEPTAWIQSNYSVTLGA
ncbi:hypothetical protein VB773_04665 [Haloarculaceae archaeon H-GB2-1]|nr:hypothetical protein [Haloarculaceae archaeon H-GB1-1]MEA5388890.1 hypothetical protein [Haloarculaceae archaeon H-GB11]MEA5406943.1 hypothetical protein [Haloarculaceae archaeon H-GB2-1]